MTSNIIHHLRELQDAWRRQEFVFTNKQTEEYSILLAARRQVVRGFYETGRVFKGSKASADKIRDEEEKANPVEVEDEEY
jgi:dsDNA-binding SOS-regulon protein